MAQSIPQYLELRQTSYFSLRYLVYTFSHILAMLELNSSYSLYNPWQMSISKDISLEVVRNSEQMVIYISLAHSCHWEGNSRLKFSHICSWSSGVCFYQRIICPLPRWRDWINGWNIYLAWFASRSHSLLAILIGQNLRSFF